MQLPYNDYPYFYEEDIRKDRPYAPSTKEDLEKKHSVILPADTLKNKTVLDLGSCYGATGQWVLYYGASKYVGVELQEKFVNKSRKFLNHHGDKVQIIQSDLIDFLDNNNEKFDIVCGLGILMCFIDYYSVIRKMCEASSDLVIMDVPSLTQNLKNTNPSHNMLVQYRTDQDVISDSQTSLKTHVGGCGVRMGMGALNVVFSSLGFDNRLGRLHTVPNVGHETTYNDSNGFGNDALRYLVTYQRTDKYLKSLSDSIKYGETKEDIVTTDHPKPERSYWKFDTIVDDFVDHAERSIPGYRRVQDLCLEVTKDMGKSFKICDVGCSTGETLKLFYNHGFKNLYGVDNCQKMIDKCEVDAQLYCSDKFNFSDNFDVVIANWTLHFIEKRREYIEDIFKSLNNTGVFILTEKVTSTDHNKKLYYDFKKRNGFTENEILDKERLLQGVLISKPIEWYLMTLREIGFLSVDIIHSEYSFITFMARKTL